MKSNNIKLSIFGSTGFIGGNFVRLYPDHIKIKRGNLNPESDDILYFISTVDNYNVFHDLTKDVKVNLELLCKVLENCKSSKITFNFISSWFVYGKNCNLPAHENDSCNPTGFYAITKKCAEDLLISFCKTFGVEYRIIRLCNVLGRGDKGASKRKNAVTWMINLLKENKSIDLYDNGEVVRDFLHVNDVCDAINLICEKGKKNNIYNISSGQPTKIKSLIDLAYQYTNSSSKINFIKQPEFHSIVQNKDFWMENNKLKELGFRQKFPLEQIVKELCD